MNSLLDLCFDRMFRHEGGYVNDPSDPGGETNFGISKRSYPGVDIRNLTREDAKAIYYRDFWRRIEADTLPRVLTYQVFDFAVNSGISTALRYLQRAVGVADDGHWGPASAEALAKADINDVTLKYIASRLDFMTRLKNWKDHGTGWARRIAQNLVHAAEDN